MRRGLATRSVLGSGQKEDMENTYMYVFIYRVCDIFACLFVCWLAANYPNAGEEELEAASQPDEDDRNDDINREQLQHDGKKQQQGEVAAVESTVDQLSRLMIARPVAQAGWASR